MKFGDPVVATAASTQDTLFSVDGGTKVFASSSGTDLAVLGF